MATKHHVSAVIFDLDDTLLDTGTHIRIISFWKKTLGLISKMEYVNDGVCVCVDAESVTRGILNDFLATYGKTADAGKEEGRLGQSHREYAAGIIADYGLPLTLEEYSEAIFPLYLKSWQKAKPLPGVRRLLKHLHKNGVPLALASNS
ncbi:unnamed protein product [Triticum turgidum subsp. durum]|uniref:Uncharacterized protein n=2 Tax=Triticum TaxID=4564 RepID=A0A9R1S4W6_TRITD|nr:unnamed protein product [Triticum aestivum]VAH79855.1 unnamed protein product [Triticum turgidum subsp. durum]